MKSVEFVLRTCRIRATVYANLRKTDGEGAAHACCGSFVDKDTELPNFEFFLGPVFFTDGKPRNTSDAEVRCARCKNCEVGGQ